MLLLTNLVGDRGENAVQMCFLKAIAGHNGFEAHFLGAKAQLLDFHVALLDVKGKRFGPHFFVQVKTKKAPSASPMFVTHFGANSVSRVKAGWVPMYIAGVEIVNESTEKVWVCGLSGQKTLNSIPKLFDLKKPATLKRIYGEVSNHFRASSYSFATKFK